MQAQPHLFFQYCQKLIILSEDKQTVLLAKRAGEADYDGTFSFIGGKMETTDLTLVAGMKREKDEEIGEATIVRVVAEESYNVLFHKKDGSSMIIPHIAGIFESGEIVLSDEYSEFKWVPVVELEAFEPKVGNIPELTAWAITKLDSTPVDQLTRI